MCTLLYLLNDTQTTQSTREHNEQILFLSEIYLKTFNLYLVINNKYAGYLAPHTVHLCHVNLNSYSFHHSIDLIDCALA